MSKGHSNPVLKWRAFLWLRQIARMALENANKLAIVIALFTNLICYYIIASDLVGWANHWFNSVLVVVCRKKEKAFPFFGHYLQLTTKFDLIDKQKKSKFILSENDEKESFRY